MGKKKGINRIQLRSYGKRKTLLIIKHRKQIVRQK
jgi:hypothetical protein